jgi:hypothetical protein
MKDFFNDFPVVTFCAVIITLVGAYDVLDGSLSPDFKAYAGEVGVMLGLLGIGRGINGRTREP